MKKFVSTFLFAMAFTFSFACEVCDRQKPKALRGITHGAGAQSEWDYWIVGITAVIVLISLYFSVKWLIRPGEKSSSHIKYIILNAE
jgi:hypothetical protein